MFFQNYDDEDSNSDNSDEYDVINEHDNDLIRDIRLLKNEKNDICENFSFIFFLFMLESIISSVCFYLFYLFDFCKLYTEIVWALVYLLIVFYIFIPLFILSDYYKKHKRCRNYALFILINIHKIVFGLTIYISIVFYSNKTLNFPDFEAKEYWKYTMCLFYFLLMVYSLFKKGKAPLNFFIYAIFGIICLSLLIVLLSFFTQTKNDKNEIIGLYALMSGLEIIFFIIGFYYEKFTSIGYDINRQSLNLDWKINRLEIYRYHFLFMIIYIIYIKKCLKKCYNKYRYCRLIKRNFS